MSGAALPLLGTFHEFSVSTDDVRGALEFYERLGLRQAPTTDTFRHPYGVLGDGRLYLGLHGRSGPSPVLTFVRPAVAAGAIALADAGVQLTVNETGEEMFHRVGFDDPDGQHVAIIEARTFSPLPGATRGDCGDFAAVSLPAADPEAARAFWEPLGFVATEEAALPYPHLPLTSDLLNLSFHSPRLYDRPMLVFQCDDPARQAGLLRERGVPLAASPPRGLRNPHSAWIEAPDGTALLLTSG